MLQVDLLVALPIILQCLSREGEGKEAYVAVIQGDTSGYGELPVDFITKVPFWHGLPWPCQAKTELVF